MKNKILFSKIMPFLIITLIGCTKEKDNHQTEDTPIYRNGLGEVDERGATILVDDPDSPLNGVKLVVPKGALNASATIEITKAPDDIVFPGDSNQLIIQLLPEGLRFQKAVLIEFPLQYDNNIPSIYHYDPVNEVITELSDQNIDHQNKTISAKTDHFSYFTSWEETVGMSFNMIKTEDNTVGVMLNVFGQTNNEKALKNIPTTYWQAIHTGNANAWQVLTDIDISYPYSVFRVRLYRNQLIGAEAVANAGFEIRRDMATGTGGAFYAEVLKQEDAEIIYKSGDLSKQDIGGTYDNLGRWFSGEPIIFLFENYSPDPNENYFVKAGWALSEGRSYLNNDNYTPVYYFNNEADKQKLQQMQTVGINDIDNNNNYVLNDFEIWGSGQEPVCNFKANQTLTETNQIIQFTDLSSNNPTEWQWDFGDGNTSTLQNPDHAYEEAGNFTVSLTVGNEYGTDNETKTNYIHVQEGAWGEPCPGIPTVTDIDNNVYNTVQIGDQCWMKENLKTGITVDYANQTDNGIVERFAYDNYAPFIETYGGLYQWDEVMQYTTTEGAQGICPEGWHIPTLVEYQEMIDLLGGENIAGAGLKSTSDLWFGQENATNKSGFTALPGGYRNEANIFYAINYGTYFWTSTIYPAVQAESIGLVSHSNKAHIEKRNRAYANYVRCIKDE